FNLHHIASDGWSMGILVNEFSELYNAHVLGQQHSLPPLDIQYADYAHWQRNWLQGAVLESQLDYWRQQLADLPTVHNLALDHPRPPVQTYRGQLYRQQLSPQTTDALAQFCQRHQATLFMGLHGVFSVLLARYANQTDIVIGTVVANREQAEVAGLIGFFVNNLVLRSDLSGSPSFEQCLQNSRRLLLDAYAHQQVPFELLVEQLQPQRSQRHSPLFQVALILQNNPSSSLDLAGLQLTQLEQAQISAKYDLTLDISQTDQGLSLNWIVNSDLFNPATTARMAEHFERLLNALLQTPQQSVFAAPMLSDIEQQRLLENNGELDRSQDTDNNIYQLFEQQVKRTPTAIALSFSEQQLSYGELEQRTCELAAYLQQQGAGPQGLIGLCVERSIEMIVAILAILKTGSTYVPLDPAYPQARLDYMISDSGITTLLTQSKLLNLFSGPDIANTLRYICLDNLDQILAKDTATDTTTDTTTRQPGADDLAYIIYTSGSTGLPKGVMIEHKALIHSTLARAQVYQPIDCFLLLSSVAFDSSVAGIFSTLISGGQLCLPQQPLQNDMAYLLSLIHRHQVSHLLTVPSLYQQLLAHIDTTAGPADQPLTSLAQITVAGEACPQTLVTQHYHSQQLKHVSLFNEYGPTEATVWSSVAHLLPDKPVNIGRAIANTQLLVLDNHHNLVPYGAVGELHISGPGLAKGYLNNPQLSEQKFVDNPFASPLTSPFASPFTSTKPRMYKTGDLVKYNDHGQLMYLGRTDSQVKLHGYRIELGEIETQLANLAQIKQAVVMLKGQQNNPYLAAYLVLSPHTDDADGADVTAIRADIRQKLATRLPEHMLPSSYSVIDAVPMTVNGKLDYQALPEPDFATGDAIIAATTPLQARLIELWQQILGHETSDAIGINNDFFHLGGSSLLLMQLGALITAELAVEIPLMRLFGLKTIAAIAGHIEGERLECHTHILHRLTGDDTQKAKFAVIGVPFIGGNAFAYDPLASVIGDNIEVYALTLPRDFTLRDDMTVTDEAPRFEAFMRQCVSEIGQATDLPLVIWGHCGGSYIALLLAQQLMAQGAVIKSVCVAASLLAPDAPERVVSAQDSIATLQSAGMDSEGTMNEEEWQAISSAFRKDGLLAGWSYGCYRQDYFADKMTVPLHIFIAEDDPLTQTYQQQWQNWSMISDDCQLITLAQGGHYFITSEKEQVAEQLRGICFG
ncbi:MAG: amino acid adenylation domain-containing protein, partial [Phenylobacterium sp.]